MANLAGKRYVCTVCGSEFIVTKAGDGQLSCHGRPLEIKGATPGHASAETPTPRAADAVEVDG